MKKERVDFDLKIARASIPGARAIYKTLMFSLPTYGLQIKY
jgi:hypothetical protein